MAWFRTGNKQGGSSEPFILSGTDNPTDITGLEGQLYLKVGTNPEYVYDEDLNGYVSKDYYIHDADTYLSYQSVNFYKTYDGGAIAVYYHFNSWYGPILISTVADNVKYTSNLTPAGTAVVDGVTWYVSSDGNWNSIEDPRCKLPFFETDYAPESPNLQQTVEDILSAAGYISGVPSKESVIDCYLSKNSTWQKLFGSNISDVDCGNPIYEKSKISYLKWQITKTRGIPAGGYLQIKEFYLYQNGKRYTWSPNVSITSNMAGNTNQEVSKLIDDNTTTKYCTPAWGSTQTNECNIVISLGETITLDGHSSYSFYTAEDEDSRDPVSWKIYGSTNGTDWILLDDRANPSYDYSRNKETQSFPIGAFGYGIKGNATIKRGQFISPSTQYGIVDINIGFKPDLLLVELPLNTPKVSTISYWEKGLTYAQTDAVWCLYPAERVSYVVALGRQNGETGIQQINNNGFSFMSNGANTRGIVCNYIAVKYEAGFKNVTNIFPYLLNNNYYTIFSKDSTNDEIYNGGRGGTRASSDPVFYFCCYANGYWGYGVIGLTSASVQITATTSYGNAEYYTQTTTNGNTVYLARLGSMNGGQSNTIFKNGYFEIDIDGSQYIEQDGSTDLFDQTFIDAAYEALITIDDTN